MLSLLGLPCVVMCDPGESPTQRTFNTNPPARFLIITSFRTLMRLISFLRNRLQRIASYLNQTPAVGVQVPSRYPKPQYCEVDDKTQRNHLKYVDASTDDDLSQPLSLSVTRVSHDTASIVLLATLT